MRHSGRIPVSSCCGRLPSVRIEPGATAASSCDCESCPRLVPYDRWSSKPTHLPSQQWRDRIAPGGEAGDRCRRFSFSRRAWRRRAALTGVLEWCVRRSAEAESGEPTGGLERLLPGFRYLFRVGLQRTVAALDRGCTSVLIGVA